MDIPDGVMLLEPREQYDSCIVGFTETPHDKWPRKTDKLCAIYSSKKLIDMLMEREGWDFEEALERVEYNMADAWMGEGTPTFQWGDCYA